MKSEKNTTGFWVAIAVLIAWAICFYYNLTKEISWSSPFTYLMVLAQAHLYTGLFITAHDSMHGTVSQNRRLNAAIGFVACNLFAFNNYKNLFAKHHEHHKFVATDADPDFHEDSNRSMWRWFYGFGTEYITWQQIALNALTFNVLAWFFGIDNALLTVVVPPILATFQLFYFGTYLPHRSDHDPENIHKSRSQPKNHIKAFFTCYFFGYHYEHHAMPYLAWWQLWTTKK